jgi:RNA polymerase sigma-70 factor (ECF subfamily)
LTNHINLTGEEQLGILEDWLRLHKGLIFKVVRAFTRTDPDDLFQEIVIQVWRSIPGFREEAAVTSWIYRIALNTALKWKKKEKMHGATEAVEKVQHLLHEASTPMDERLSWLYAEIYKLDPIDRSLTLLLLDGFSYTEMSVMLGISASHVGVKINRIKKQLIAQSKKQENHGI